MTIQSSTSPTAASGPQRGIAGAMRALGRRLRPVADPQGAYGLTRRLLADQGRRHWRTYVLAAGCMAVVAVATSGSAWLMKDVIDKVFIDRDIAALWGIAALLTALSIAKGLAAFGQQVMLARVANAIVADVQRRIFDKILDLPIAAFAARHSTEFLARQAFISQSAAGVLNLLITSASRDALTLLGLAAVMIVQDPLMSVLGLVFMPVAVLGSRKLSGRVRKVMATEFAGFAEILQSLSEATQGIRLVKAFTLEGHMRGRQHAAIDNFERASNKLAAVSARSSPMMESLGGLAIAGVVVYGGLRVILDNQPPGAFFSFITALLLAYEPAKRLARFQIDYSASMVGVGMLYGFLDEGGGENDASDAPALRLTAGRIAFRDVSFTYRAGEPVLRGLDLVAEGARTTALVGRSGGGKSTLMALMLRYWDVAEGSIEIDGTDIRQVSRASLRRSVAYVSQETFLFTGTIGDNIGLGRPGATRDEIEAAARAAHAHEFIMGFERGYDSPCGEHGLQLSGGQRQRIAIARAFLKDAPILLLDEATSALDSESERAVQDALERLRQGRTVLVIAHRLSTIRSADDICVVEGGRIVEHGRHDELMERDGAYRAMVVAQFGEA